MRESVRGVAKVSGVSLILVLAVLVFAVEAKSDREERGNRHDDDRDRNGMIQFSVTHGVVETILTTPGSGGHALGDLRVLEATQIYDADGELVGRLDAQLVTSSVDFPTVGDEIRMSTLNFIFGAGESQFSGSANQLVVSGSGFYPGTESTIAINSDLVRPITGGSGEFEGATGSALTEHFADGTWRHTFRIHRP